MHVILGFVYSYSVSYETMFCPALVTVWKFLSLIEFILAFQTKIDKNKYLQEIYNEN